jgi:uncharacterized SAM-binding protein YcdF (DUF218 family)
MNDTKRQGMKKALLGIFRAVSMVFTAAFLIIMFTPLSNYMAKPLTMGPELKKTDLIAVLGGGAFPNGVLGGASNERLIHGMLLYREGYAPEIIFSGGTIRRTSKKVLHTVFKSGDASKMDVIEADIMREVSTKLGIPEEDTSADPSSTNTHGNLERIGEYMETRGLETCLIVTSPTHMYRSLRVSEKLGLDCYPAPVIDYTEFIDSALGRLGLFRAVMWEYAGLLLYSLYGYI